MNLKSVGLLALFALLIVSVAARAEVTAERTDKNVEIKIDGQPFTEYHPQAGHSSARAARLSRDRIHSRLHPQTARRITRIISRSGSRTTK
jgi:hypothetical protein